jgi:hypothetical protein
MAKCKGFRNFKERGEWVELTFMARAIRKRFKVSKPWGDSSPYDVGVEHGAELLRVQVKSTSHRLSNGYQCGLRPNPRKSRRQYSTRKVDFFAAYIVPEDVWYIIPAAVVLKTKSSCVMLCPVRKQRMRSDSYCYERYREAWPLLRTAKRHK